MPGMPRIALSSLRSRLTALVLLTVLPALALLVHSALEQRRAAAADARASALRLTRLLSGDYDQTIREGRLLLRGLATLPQLREARGPGCADALRAVREGNPRYLNFGVLGVDGAVLCSAREIPTGMRPTAAGMAAIERAARTRDFAFSGFAVGQLSRRPLLYFVEPIVEDGAPVRRVLYASLSLDWLNQAAAEAELPPGSTLSLYDTAGVVLVHFPRPDGWVGRQRTEPWLRALLRPGGPGTYVARDADGVERLFGATALRASDTPASGLVVVVGLPTRVIFAPADATLRASLLALALVALLMVAAAWIGGDLFVVRPVTGLLAAARRLKAGDVDARSGVESGVREVRELARGFDEMAHALQEREAQLQRQNEALRQSEERFRQLAENVREVFWIATPEHDAILYVSPAYEEVWGRPAETLYTRPESWRESLHPDDRAGVLAKNALLGQGSAEYDVEYRIVRPDGSIRWIHDRGFAVRDADGEVYRVAGLAEDVTVRKQTEAALRRSEEQLLQAQKMEAVGRLAGGVAHDFNNLLTAIKGNVELALLDLPAAQPAARGPGAGPAGGRDRRRPSPASSWPSAAASAARRRRWRSTPRRGEHRAAAAAPAWGRSVELVTDLDPGLGPVRADPAQLEQLLINLAVNARDAMPEGGICASAPPGARWTPDRPREAAHAPPGRLRDARRSPTRAWGWTPGCASASSSPSSPPRSRARARASGSSSSTASSTSAAGTSGWRASRARAPPSTSSARTSRAPRSRRPPPPPPPVRAARETILLVEDEPPVRTLTAAPAAAHRLPRPGRPRGPEARPSASPRAPPASTCCSPT